jgi:hypothetical protein
MLLYASRARAYRLPVTVTSRKHSTARRRTVSSTSGFTPSRPTDTTTAPTHPPTKAKHDGSQATILLLFPARYPSVIAAFAASTGLVRWPLRLTSQMGLGFTAKLESGGEGGDVGKLDYQLA